MSKRFRSLLLVLSGTLAAVLVFAGVSLYRILKEYDEGAQTYENMRDLFYVDEVAPVIADSSPTLESSSGQFTNSDHDFTNTHVFNSYKTEGSLIIQGVPLTALMPPAYTRDFTKLLELNEQVIGWITIDGTNIDYPVVITDDNEYYLRHTIEGDWNNCGSIFADYRQVEPFDDSNTILYGHNQKNHQMFHDLIYYADESYREEHPLISLYTPSANYTYEIFSAYQTTTDGPAYTYAFAYETEETFSQYLQEIQAASAFHTGFRVTAENKILTLSTCTNNAHTEERFVVHAKLIAQKSGAAK